MNDDESPLFGGGTTAPTAEPAEKSETGSDKDFVRQWTTRVTAAKGKYRTAFERMRKCSYLARNGEDPHRLQSVVRDEDNWGSERYITNITGQQVTKRVADLYAKNFRVRWIPRPFLPFAVWDGNPDTYVQALQFVQQAGMMGPGSVTDPMLAMQVQQANEIVMDVQQGIQMMKMRDKIGQTLETLFRYHIDVHQPTFKRQMKRLVRRICTCGVGYIGIEFRADGKLSHEQNQQIVTMEAQLAELQGAIYEVGKDGVTGDDPRIAEIQAMMEAISGAPSVRMERLQFCFPRATSIIPDPDTTSIIGWEGTDWIAHEFVDSVRRIHSIYGVDLRNTSAVNVGQYADDGNRVQWGGTEMAPLSDDDQPDYVRDKFCRLFYVKQRSTGLEFVLADGYCGYVMKPRRPAIFTSHFFNLVPITFNDDEREVGGYSEFWRGRKRHDLFPVSDVYNMRHPQRDINLAMEARRQHVRAAQPKLIYRQGQMTSKDVEKFALTQGIAILGIEGLNPGEKAVDVMSHLPWPGIDNNLHDIGPHLRAGILATGMQQADVGSASGATATETSIIEAASGSTTKSSIDDFDDALSEVADIAAQILISESSPEFVRRVIGPGAVWPELNRQDLIDQITLQSEAGSSGLPNQAHQAAIVERLAPTLLQMPGIAPIALVKYILSVLDSNLDVDRMVAEGLPSIMAMNRMAQVPTGGAEDPNAQGQEGGDKAPRPAENEQGPQPAYPVAGSALAGR